MKLTNKIIVLVSLLFITSFLEASNKIEFDLITSTAKSLKVSIDNNNKWHFEGIKNKVVIVDFFGTWCPPCKASIPHLNSMRENYKNDFEIIGVDIGLRRGGENTLKALNDFIKEYKIKYPVTLGKDNNKLLSAVGKLNPNGSIPFMLLFSKDGQFLQYYLGMQPEELIKSNIEQAIEYKGKK